MKNNDSKLPELDGTLSSDIENDFQKVLSILSTYFLEPNSQITSELKKMHNALYIYRSICNDLLIAKNDKQTIQSLIALNQHLLISTLIFILKNDDYTVSFLLRGSLESSIKVVHYMYGLEPTDSFSNNLEIITKKIKDNLIIDSMPLRKKRSIRTKINSFTTYGRANLYSSLSDKIHIRKDINTIPSIYLDKFFNRTSSINLKLSSLFINIVEYETVFTMLKIDDLKTNKISYPKIEYFRSNYNQFEYLISIAMKLL